MFDRSDDQELLAETTARFLDEQCPLSVVRKLAGDSRGYTPSFWRQGAELGWTSLLVSAELGGGTVSDSGVMDLSLIAWQFGFHAAPGPLLPTNIVAAALSRAGSREQQTGPLARLLSGDAVAAWATGSSADPSAGSGGLRVTAAGDFVQLDGIAMPVEAAVGADHLLVVASDGAGLRQYLLSTDTPGVNVVPLAGLDITRRFARIELDRVIVPESAAVAGEGAGPSLVSWLADLAVVVQLAEMAGAMQWAFDTTLQWTFDRYSFGRPLASYQEIKHRLADMKMVLEASYAIVQAAASAVEHDSPDRSKLVSAAKCYVARQGPELMQDCVQLHGGIGVTFEHDLHLFLRRVATGVPLFGSPAEHAVRISHILEGAA